MTRPVPLRKNPPSGLTVATPDPQKDAMPTAAVWMGVILNSMPTKTPIMTGSRLEASPVSARTVDAPGQ